MTDFSADSQVINLWGRYSAAKETGDRLFAEECDQEDTEDQISDAYGAMHVVADQIGALIPKSVLALGAHLIHEIDADDNDNQVLRAHRASVWPRSRPQFVGAIAADARSACWRKRRRPDDRA